LAVNLWRDQAKSAAARREVPAGVFGPDLDPVATDPLPGPPEQAERRLAAEQVWHAVSGLPKGMREVIVLRFGQDLKVTEIASALGLAEGTVKTRLYYGLRRLREPLAEVGTDHDA
jgi:RNA polymerase sigma-70 factor (ECF subfamily)